MSESRVSRKSRLASGVVKADDVKAFYSTANRLRAMWGRISSVRLPLDEVSLDTLLTAKEEAQQVIDAAGSGEDIIRDLLLEARAASDPLLVPIVTDDGVFTGNYSVGLDTHPKNFTVEHRQRENVRVGEMLDAMIRDGLLTIHQAQTYRAAFTSVKPYDSIGFRPRKKPKPKPE